MSLRRRRWSTSADAPFRNERRPLNESRRRRPKHPFVRESMETACNACCRRFFHVGRFLTDDLFPGFMMPSDPAVRSRRPIPPSDPAVRSRRSIPPLDPAARSRRPIPPLDPAVRSGRPIPPSDPAARSSRSIPPLDPAVRSGRPIPPDAPSDVPPCTFPTLLFSLHSSLQHARRFSDAPLCTFPAPSRCSTTDPGRAAAFSEPCGCSILTINCLKRAERRNRTICC